MTLETVETTLIPLAAELIGTIRDYSTDDVAAVLDRAEVPQEARPLVVVLAAMIDPDASPRELLAWTEAGPVQSREKDPGQLRSEWGSQVRLQLPREHGSERGYYQHRRAKDLPACDSCRTAHSAANQARGAS